mmetsp:Transcript_25040/g.57657  ORF Transcript_25040/g.57657 Transcript_25040/m.57657 type:complete len:267 (-) Transcript_25040:5232-6032(-)
MSSRLVTERAPWRMAVATQSVPVSPPPMTMTSLSLADSSLGSVQSWTAQSSTPGAEASLPSVWKVRGLWSKRVCCVFVRNSMASWMPLSSCPLIGRGRGAVAPVAIRTAWYSSRRFCSVREDPGSPTLTPSWNSTPSAAMRSRRRCTTRLSSFMFGMPYISSPPALGARSRTVTLWPMRLSSSAAARPAGPLPMTATRMLVRVLGGRGRMAPDCQPQSAMAYSMFLMVTGSATRPAMHAPSQGAGHTRPVNSGKGLVRRSRSKARR